MRILINSQYPNKLLACYKTTPHIQVDDETEEDVNDDEVSQAIARNPAELAMYQEMDREHQKAQLVCLQLSAALEC